MADLFIGDLARRVGVSAKAIRHYESLGLLGEPRRSDAGYRLYSEAEVARLRFVLGAKALGLALAEIRDIVGVWDGGEAPCGQVSRLLDEKLAALDVRIDELMRFREDLRAYKAQVDATGVAGGHWNPPLAPESPAFPSKAP